MACNLEIISFQCSAAKMKAIFRYDFILFGFCNYHGGIYANYM